MNGNATGHVGCKKPDLNHRACKVYTQATRTCDVRKQDGDWKEMLGGPLGCGGCLFVI